MDKKILNTEKRLCTCCMENHEVQIIKVREKSTFKNKEIEYDAVYWYCDATEELYMDEKQMQENDIRLKDAYRKKVC